MSMMRSKSGKRLMSDINVTPLVDVMLVLLIIFMITAPMMTQGVDIDLPQTTSQPLRQKDDPLTISINKEGRIKLKETEMSQSLIVQELAKMPEEDKQNQMIYLSADKNVPYGTVVSLFADIRNAGFVKLGMVTEHTDKSVEMRK
jgi:biopolymer transport protein TolR